MGTKIASGVELPKKLASRHSDDFVMRDSKNMRDAALKIPDTSIRNIR
jgi:hypothetical protein